MGRGEMSQPAKVFSARLPKFDFEEAYPRSTSQHSIVSIHFNERAIEFKPDDLENAEKWSCVLTHFPAVQRYLLMAMQAKKLFAVGTSLLVVTNSAISSSLPGGAVVYTAVHFQVTSQQQLALPMCVFLVGYIFGPLAFGPLSETYGRRIILLITFTGYTIFTLACALAPSWPALLVFRFFVGLCISAPYTLAGGICADVYSDAAHRGRAIMALMIVGGGQGQ